MDIDNKEVPDTPVEVATESPLTGSDESFGDLKPGEQSPEMSDQAALSQGGAEDQQRTDGVNPQADLGPAAGEAPEGKTPELYSDENEVKPENPDIANPVKEVESFWGGAFGKPKMPILGE